MHSRWCLMRPGKEKQYTCLDRSPRSGQRHRPSVGMVCPGFGTTPLPIAASDGLCHVIQLDRGLTLEQRSPGGSEIVERADITQHPCMVPAAPRGLRLAAEQSHRATCTRFPGCMTTLCRLGAWPADMHCLTALDAGSLKSRCQKMQFPRKGFLSGRSDDCLLSVSSPGGKREISELSAVSSYKDTIL